MQEYKSKIKSIQFGLFSPSTIKALSVLNVIHPETIENGVPKESGLADTRMGSSDFSILCTTCHSNSQDCQGHFGHIELTKPVFHIGYLQKIKKVLETVCFYCSSIKSKKHEREIKNNNNVRQKLNLCWSNNKTKTLCETCGNKQPLIRKEGLNLLAFMKANDNEGKMLVTPEKVHGIFKKICDSDIEDMGFDTTHSRPEYMILTTIIVAPPATRPAILSDGLRSEDDLTHKYADIIKSNINLRKYESEGAPTHILRDYEQLLQFHVATLIDNDISGQPQALQKSGRPLKSISARLKGKEGRLRYNLMGKRVDFSARTVITPDPNISLGEVGVPISIAMIHTYNEIVNPLNIEKLQALVNLGPGHHPGANYVIRTDGQRIDLRFNRTDIYLQEGYIVERHLQDGDIVLFNRQPSLHKMSMMAHTVRVMDKKTFRLNLSVTSPYNADFDGDEMNLHTPQNLLCVSELADLAAVSTQIVSPQSNRPVMGIVQDTLIGVRKLTLDGVFVSEREAMQLFYAMPSGFKLSGPGSLNSVLPPPTVLRPTKLYSGKQIFSWALPDINFSCLSTDEKRVLIIDGILHKGVIDKKSVGAVEGGIIHIIFNDFGREIATRFFDSVQRIVNYFMTNISCFSIGIGDTIASKELKQEISDNIEIAENEVKKLIDDPSQLSRLPGMSLRETFESLINVSLNKARNVSGSCAQKYLLDINNVKQMVMAGSKGSLINISQMTACVGQQNVEGKRIPFGFRNRTLPHFPKDDYSPKSRGFVQNSYLTGLEPEEFFFHAMGGREGLIDTAVKTAETGYIQRRLIKAMEDLRIEYDGSVRTSVGCMTQFAYGDDGFRGECIERQKICNIKHNNKKNSTDYNDESITRQIHNIRLTGERNHEETKYLLYELINNASEEVKESYYDHADIIYDELQVKSDETYYLPCNLKRLFWNATRKFDNKKTTLTPTEMFRKRNELIDFVLENISTNKVMGASMSEKMVEFLNLNFTLSTALKNRFCFEQLEYIAETFKEKFISALAVTNEMVGTLAAQSVGEPATQMTLNTFHYAGVASTVTLGVPRLKEIINVAKTLKTPSMRIELLEPYCDSINGAKIIQAELEYTVLSDVIENIQVIYDPIVTDTVIEEDKDFVGLYFLCPDEEVLGLGYYVIRMVINREKMIGRGLSLSEIVNVLKSEKNNVIHSDENAETLVIRVRTNRTEEEDNVNIMNVMIKTHLKGFKNIKKAFLVEENGKFIIQTEGVNLKELLSYDKIRTNTLKSNNIIEICEVLGIEAARCAVLEELKSVIENEGYVNSRHLGLLSDVMTNKGILTGITRHGVNRGNKSALVRCSFEETVDILLEAAMLGEKSNCKEVTECIILGQEVPIGTGCTHIYLDVTMLKDAVPLAKRVFYDFEKEDYGSPDILSPVSQESSLGPLKLGFSPQQSDGYKINSPGHHVQTPGFLPTTQSYTNQSGLSPSYTPTSPSYTPTSPSYTPISPSYTPTSPSYTPTSPMYCPNNTVYSPTSPLYGATTPRTGHSPTSPAYSPNHQRYNASSPSYSPNINHYSPTTPVYRPSIGRKKKDEKNSESEEK